MSEPAFLDAIIEEPDEDVHRLVFADWLDDHGQGARAEFLRTQVALATMNEDDPHRAALEERERRLLAENAPAWAGPWPGRVEFRRGLVEAVEGYPTADQLGRHPVRELRLSGTPAELAEVGGRDELPRVEAIEISGQRLVAGTDAFLRSGRLARLRLSLLSMYLTDQTAADCTGLPTVARLERLHLNGRLGSEGVFLRRLAGGAVPGLIQGPVEAVASARGGGPPACRRAQAGGPCPRRTEVLPYRARVGEPSFTRDRAPDPAPALAAFVRSDAWSRLRSLAVAAGPTFPWAEALANGRLRRLDVRTRRRDALGPLAAALRSFSGEPTLEDVMVSAAVADADTFSGVLASPAVARVRRLRLGGGPYPDPLTLRLLWWDGPRPAALERLLGGPAFPRLCAVPFFEFEVGLGPIIDVLRRCERVAWAGSESEYGRQTGVKPAGVYLPNYLAEA